MARQSSSDNGNQELAELTPTQRQVIYHLVAGDNQKTAAEAAGVVQETVSRWCNHNAQFIAALNAERMALWQDQADKLRSLLPKALEVVAAALEDGDVATARDIIKSVGLAEVARDIGSGDAERVEYELAMARLGEVERIDMRLRE